MLFESSLDKILMRTTATVWTLSNYLPSSDSSSLFWYNFAFSLMTFMLAWAFQGLLCCETREEAFYEKNIPTISKPVLAINVCTSCSTAQLSMTSFLSIREATKRLIFELFDRLDQTPNATKSTWSQNLCIDWWYGSLLSTGFIRMVSKQRYSCLVLSLSFNDR
jgi:hypothetical protein